MSKRLFSIVLSVMLVGVLFTGCTGNYNPDEWRPTNNSVSTQQSSAVSSSSSQSSMVIDQTERIELKDKAFQGTGQVGKPLQLTFSFTNVSKVDIDGFRLITNDLKNFSLQDATGHPLYTPGLIQQIKWSEGGVVKVGETKDFIMTLVPLKAGNYNNMLFTFAGFESGNIYSGDTKNSAQITANIAVTQ